MAQQEPNRSGEMMVFARVIEAGGFSGAARLLKMTPSAVSKVISRLEGRLGARLLTRSTRRLELTPEGRDFYERTTRILADIFETERIARRGEAPTGRVRINSSASYVTHVLGPVLQQFLASYPEIDLDIVQTDTVVDLLADHTDVAIRAGPLADSSLVARKLGTTRLLLVAAPAWITRARTSAGLAHGLSNSPEALGRLNERDRLSFGYRRASQVWSDPDSDGSRARVAVNDGEGIRNLALAGVGPARLAEFTIRDDLSAGRLMPLDQGSTIPTEVFHAVYIGGPGPVPVRARVFLSFIAEHGKVD